MTVGIDTLILLYMIMLATVMAFNVVYFMVTKAARDTDKRQSGYFARRLKKMLNRAEDGKEAEGRDKRYLKRALKRTRNMLMFETITTSYDRPTRSFFFKSIESVFILLAPVFRERSGLEMAYFAHLVQLTRSGAEDSPAGLYATLMHGLDNESLYCRDASLKALVTIAGEQTVLDALRRINSSSRYYYPDLITQALNCVPEDKQKRILDSVISWFDSFLPFIRCAIVKAARKLKCDYREAFLFVLKDATTDQETMIEIIRYFKECTYAKAKPELLHILTFPRLIFQRVIIFALWTLKAYFDEETKENVLPLLSVNDAQIQEAAAEVLIENGVTYYELIEYYNSEDDRLRRILKYMREEKGTGEGVFRAIGLT